MSVEATTPPFTDWQIDILRHTLKNNPVQDIAKATQYLTMWVQQQEKEAA